MATTVQKVFVRKFGDMAIVMTITDWKQYEELMELAEKDEDGKVHENPDFMMEGTTTKNIYSNMLPSTMVRTDNAKDITEETKGMGLGHILTSPYWGYKTIENPLDDLLG
jgi:hypothetical protein